MKYQIFLDKNMNNLTSMNLKFVIMHIFNEESIQYNISQYNHCCSII